jgi:uncharacterized metal-binding protein YceD (DUF177 family)
MSAPVSWTHPVVVADLPPEGAAFELEPDEATRVVLARHVGVLALPALRARLTVVPSGKGSALVEGEIAASVRQTCVVSLEAFEAPLREPVAMRFAPAAEPPPGLVVELGEEDPPDPLVGGAVDLAAVVTEFLALAIDPYPRKPGAVFVPPAGPKDPKASPFAVLGKLQSPRGAKD